MTKARKMFGNIAWCILLSFCFLQTNSRAAHRLFDFHKDTFYYTNHTVWRYELDPQTGRMRHEKILPKPDYTLHCFVMARCAQRFFQHATFDATLPPVSAQELKKRLKKVLRCARPHEPVTLPGYANLREFSQRHEALTKKICGGAWRSYLQRGNWRMVFPFTRSHQQRTARQLQTALDQGGLPVVHISRFPRLDINHAVVLFAYEQGPGGALFSAYDPNDPNQPLQLGFDSTKAAFTMPATPYFQGGKVGLYQIYHKLLY